MALYVVKPHISMHSMIDREMKKGCTELGVQHA
jgi:hypothetical protein